MLRRGAVEINQGFAIAVINLDRDTDFLTRVELVRETAIVQHVDDAPDAFFRVVFHMPHIGLHCFKAVVGDEITKGTLPPVIRRDLRFQIREVLVDVPAREWTGGQQSAHGLFPDFTTTHEKEVINEDAFFFDVTTVWRS